MNRRELLKRHRSTGRSSRISTSFQPTLTTLLGRRSNRKSLKQSSLSSCFLHCSQATRLPGGKETVIDLFARGLKAAVSKFHLDQAAVELPQEVRDKVLISLFSFVAEIHSLRLVFTAMKPWRLFAAGLAITALITCPLTKRKSSRPFLTRCHVRRSVLRRIGLLS